MSDDFCNQHSGHEARLITLEQNKCDLWISVDRAHTRVDGMKNWVIAGMTSLVLQLIVMIIGLVLMWGKNKAGVS